MSQHPSPHDDAEPTDTASEEAAPADPAPQEVIDPGGVTKTRKSLWMIGAGVGLYMIARGFWDMFTGAS